MDERLVPEREEANFTFLYSLAVGVTQGIPAQFWRNQDEWDLTRNTRLL